jgi:8-oxo-dGTP diphosphatase
MTDRQRIAAYGLCVDPDGRVLLARAAPSLSARGRWFLPGGGVDFGEAPAEAVRRELLEESGLTVDVGPLLDVISDVRALLDGDNLHTVRIIYRVLSWSGTLTPEVSGTTDAIEWAGPEARSTMPLARYVQHVMERHL